MQARVVEAAANYDATQPQEGEAAQAEQDPIAQAAAIMPHVEAQPHSGRVKGLGYGALPTQLFRSSPGAGSSRSQQSTGTSQPFEERLREDLHLTQQRVLEEQRRAFEQSMAEQRLAFEQVMAQEREHQLERQRAIEAREAIIEQQHEEVRQMLEEVRRRNRQCRSPPQSGDD